MYGSTFSAHLSSIRPVTIGAPPVSAYFMQAKNLVGDSIATNNVETVIIFDSETFDTGGFYNPSTGIYQTTNTYGVAQIAIGYATNLEARMSIQQSVDGTTWKVLAEDQLYGWSSQRSTLSTSADLSEGSYFRVTCRWNNATSRTFSTSTEVFLSIYELGAP